MNKLITKISALALGLGLAVGVGVGLGQSKKAEVARAAEGDIEITFPGSPSTKTSSYSKTFTLDVSDVTFTFVNWNNGSASDNWDAIRGGQKNNAWEGTITSGQIENGVSKVVVNITQIASSTGSKLEVASDSSFTSDLQTIDNGAISSTGEVEFEVPTIVENSYYRLTFNQGANANGSIRTNRITYVAGQSGQTTFGVTYDANGGIGSMEDATEYESGDVVTVLDNDFSPADDLHLFNSFNTKADGTGTSYVAGDTFNISKDTTLYAIWDIKDVTLGDGNYTATFPWQVSYPHEIDVNNSSSTKVGLLGITATGLARAGSYNEYELQATGQIVFKNHTNAPLTKVVFVAYKFDTFKLTLGSEVLHTGNNESGAEENSIEVNVPSDKQSTDDIIFEHCGVSEYLKYTQKFFRIEFYFKLGDDPVPVESVSLNAASGNVYIGKTRQLTETVLPANADEKSVTWDSSDDSIATVDSAGLVTGVAAGTATITVTTTDGGFTATFVATVKTYSAGTLESPLTPEEACEVLTINGTAASPDVIYVSGIVNEAYVNKSKNILWLKSSDLTVNRCLEVYDFTLSSNIPFTLSGISELPGKEIVASGYGCLYSGETPELAPLNEVSPTIEKITYNSMSLSEALLNETAGLCTAYVDGETHYDADTFADIWANLKKKFATLAPEEVTGLAEAVADKDSEFHVEQAMARYDLLVGKYGLENFITGRVVDGSRFIPATSVVNDNSAMLIIVIAFGVSTLFFVTLCVVRKRKGLRK